MFGALVVALSLVSLSSPPPVGAADPSPFVALSRPARVLDTRSPNGATSDGQFQQHGTVAPPEVISVKLGGRFGIPSDAGAVVVNLTVDGPTRAGWATIWPCGSAQPATSNINFPATRTFANGAVVGLGRDASVCLFSDAPAELILDVTGYFPSGGAFAALALPLRLVDSRAGGSTEDGRLAGFGPFEAKVVRPLVLAGRVPQLPSADAVALDLTAIAGNEAGWATLWPCGTSQPSTSTINFDARQTVANSALVRLAADGSICLYSSVRADFIVDVMGTISLGAQGFGPLAAPARFLDTRTGGTTDDHRFEAGGLADRDHLVQLDVAGRLGVPPEASTVVMNLTATGTQRSGWATVYPCGTNRPDTSSINFGVRTTVANGVVARVGSDGKVCIYADSPTDLIVDVVGVILGSTVSTASIGPVEPVPPTTVPPTTAPPTTAPPTTTTVVIGEPPTTPPTTTTVPPTTTTPPTTEPETAGPSASIEIGRPVVVAGNEWVTFANRGADDLDLTGWIVTDRVDHRYEFPAFVLHAGWSVTLFTGSGLDDSSSLYWGSPSAVWNESGDTVRLFDATERPVAELIYS